MSFPYNKILVLGATSGIGEALADRFVANGKKVIVVGRRQERIDAFIDAHGADKASGYAFDVTNLDEIPEFVAKVTKEHPDLDCVLLNSGIQRGFNYASPGSVDLKFGDLEMLTNYTSHVHFSVAVLPQLQKLSKQTPTAIMFTTSGAAVIPLLRCANYSASKAALHSYITCLRQQLQNDPDSSVKVIELMPPAVQTNLHSIKAQPELAKRTAPMGIPLQDYLDETWRQLEEGKELCLVGRSLNAAYGKGGFEMMRNKAFQLIVAAEASREDSTQKGVPYGAILDPRQAPVLTANGAPIAAA